MDAVQRRADAGSKVIFDGDLPFLSMQIELDQGEDTPSIEELTNLIAQVHQRLGSKPKEAKLWQALGVYKQQLVKQLSKSVASQAAGANNSNGGNMPNGLEAKIKAVTAETKQAFDEAIRLAPGDKYTYMRRAAYRLYVGDYDGTIEDSAKALMLDAEIAAAYNYRGIAHANLGYQDLAMNDFSQALTFDDCLAEAYMNRGTLYISKSEFAKSLEDLRCAYLSGFRTPALLANWGKALCGQAQWESAIRKLSEAIALDSKTAWPYVDRGFAYKSLGIHREAENDFRNATRLDPTQIFAHHNLGLIFLEQGRYREAAVAFDAAIQAGPTAPTVIKSRLSFAYANLMLKQYKQAIAQYEEIISTVPDHYAARVQLAVAYQGAGQVVSAKEQLDYVLTHAAKDSEEFKQAEQSRKDGIG